MKILLVCSGNTCRSPLAEAMLRDMVASDENLADIEVGSAGIAAFEGAPASEGSFLVALERGLDLSHHRARLLTPALVRETDLILTMSEAHARRVTALGGAGKVNTLAGYAGHPHGWRDVHDPMGGDVEGYRDTARVLDELLTSTVARLIAERRA